MVSYTFLDFMWLAFWKLFLPLGLLVLVISNLPLIIGGILGYGLGLLILPFQILYSVFFKKSKINASSNNRGNSQSDHTSSAEGDETQEQYDTSRDLYSLLGVSTTATKEEIRAAFKAKMMMNHPDKLASLDPELQLIATQRTVAIKDAYERLTAHTN